jgi:hypothetical protein
MLYWNIIKNLIDSNTSIGVTEKEGEMISGLEIPSILNTNSTRFAGNFRRAERRLQEVLFLNLNASSQANFVILILWISRDQTSLDFLSRSQLIVNECGSSSFNNRSPQMLPSHHYIISLRSWIETKNRAGRCDHLHLIASSSSKNPEAPTISQVLPSQSKPHKTFSLKPPKTDKDDGCHYNRS